MAGSATPSRSIETAVALLAVLALVVLSSCGTAAQGRAQPADVASLTVTTIPPPPRSGSALRVPGSLRIAFVSGSGGIDDGAMNAQALREVRRLTAGQAAEPAVFSSADPSDYPGNLGAAADQAQLVIGLGSDMAEPLVDAARAHPRTAFALLDAPADQPSPPNVRWLPFDSQQVAFLAGSVSAGLSRSHTAGFVGGRATASQRALLKDFRDGARFFDPGVSVVSAFAGRDNDQVTAKRLAQNLLGQKADVVFADTFVNSLGAIAATSQARRTAIGVGRDEFLVAPNAVVTSILERTDVAAEVAIADYLAGRRSGSRELSVKDGAISLAPFRTTGPVDPRLLGKLSEAQRELAHGSLP